MLMFTVILHLAIAISLKLGKEKHPQIKAPKDACIDQIQILMCTPSVKHPLLLQLKVSVFFSFCNALFPSKNAFNFYVVFFWQQQQVCMLMVSQVLHKILVISYKVKKEIGAQVRPPEGLCVSVLS